MSVTIQSKILPLGQLLQNEPHLRLHTLRLARNGHFNWAEFAAINGGIGLVDGEGITPVDGVWPDDAFFLARTERANGDGEESPWIFCCYTRNVELAIEFPDLAVGPITVATISAAWRFDFVEIMLPVNVWHRFKVTLDVESDPTLAWASWGERPLGSGDLVPGAVYPALLEAPVITGDTVVGETLTCSSGVWAGYPRPTYTYQWYKEGGDPISGADEFRWVVTAALIGFDVFCGVTATNSEGSETEFADAVGPVTAAPATDDLLLTEGGDTLTTESGDSLALE